MNELKPCPFCGNKVRLSFGMSENAFIWCGECKVDMGGDEYVEELVKRWNQRRFILRGELVELV